VQFLSLADLKAGEYLIRARMQGEPGSIADVTEQLRITVPARAAGAVPPPGQPLMFRRGPFTGPAFQPTADSRFRRVERLRVDVSLADTQATLSARLLDRKGQSLPVPVVTTFREETRRQYATAEVALTPLGQADYLVELSIQRGQEVAKVIVPIRIVP
jgi:hypothetical protein